jgi:Tol biopolymer transport system component
MRRCACLALLFAACIPPGSSMWGQPAAPTSADGTAAAAPADTAPPSPELAVTGAARDLAQLTTAPGNETRPAASPDGKVILFTAWQNQITDGQDTGTLAEETISAVHADGRGLTTYSSRRAFGFDAAWLGERGFAFVSNAMGEFQIVRAARLAANAATTVIVRAEAAPEAGGLSSSRDGKLLAFHAKLQGQFMIMTVRPDGGELTTVAQGSYPRLSPDGQRLVFQRQVGDSWRIFVTAVDGGDETQVTDGEMDCESATWSPDGAWLVMACNGGWQRFPDATADVRNLFAIRPDGGGLTQLTDGARLATAPEFAADGAVYFASNAGGSIDLWKITPTLTP